MAVSLKKGVYIVAGKRTPFGKLGGMFRDVPAEDIFATAAKAALKAGGVRPEVVDTTNIGTQSSLWKPNKATNLAAQKSGLAPGKPVLAVNKLSGSGLHAAIISAQEIILGSAHVSLAGGMENFSAVPYLLRNTRFEINHVQDLALENWLFHSYYDSYCQLYISQTSDRIATKIKISREEADEYALSSHKNWKAANDNGIFKTELATLSIEKDGSIVTLTTDELPRPDSTLERFSRVRPLFEGGVTTHANVSGISDGAGAIILASEHAVTQHNMTPLSRLAGWSCIGVDPSLMGYGPVPAVQNLLAAVGLTLDDIDIIELHESFATQVLACANELKVDRSKLNLNGGAVSMGHPSSASGARLISHVTHELRRRKFKRGVIGLALSGGQGIAILIETL